MKFQRMNSNGASCYSHSHLLLNQSPYTKDDLLNYNSLDCYMNFTAGCVREILVKVCGEAKEL